MVLTQKPARARCLEVRRKITKVEARAMSAIMVPNTLPPWSSYKLSPGGGPGMLDGPDMVWFDEDAGVRW